MSRLSFKPTTFAMPGIQEKIKSSPPQNVKVVVWGGPAAFFANGALRGAPPYAAGGVRVAPCEVAGLQVQADVVEG